MRFETDPEWGGYFIRRMTIPVDAEGTLEDGMLRMSSLDFKPFVVQDRKGKEATFTGSIPIVLEAIMTALHIQNATISGPMNEPFEQRMSNGSIGGIMGRIQRKEVDISINPLITTDRRLLYIYPVDLMVVAMELLVFKPRKTVHPFSFVRAFQPEVWLTLFVCVNLVAACMFIIDRYFVRGRFGTRPYPLGNYLWEFWRRLFPQDPLRRADNWLQVCILLFMFAIPMQLLVVFSGVLTSSMAIREPEDHINSGADVLRFKNVRVYAEARTSMSLLFLYPTSELFRKLARRYVPMTGSLTLEPSFYPRLEEVERREAVMLGNENVFAPMIEKLKIHRGGVCPHLTVAETPLGTILGSMVCRLTLPREFRQKFARGVRAIAESYIFMKAQEWILRKTYACLQTQDDPQTALSFSDLLGSFTVWAIGIACAFVGLAGELLSHYKSAFRCRIRPSQLGRCKIRRKK